MLSHMLDCQLFGLNAWGHHLTNVLLHAAASIALFLVLWRMTGELWPSAFVAAVFAVHPQHVESRGLDGRAARRAEWAVFHAHAGGLSRLCPPRPVACRAICWWPSLFALGLMAKPMLVTLPALLLLLDFWPLARFGYGRAIHRPGLGDVERPGAAVWCWKSCRWWRSRPGDA